MNPKRKPKEKLPFCGLGFETPYGSCAWILPLANHMCGSLGGFPYGFPLKPQTKGSNSKTRDRHRIVAFWGKTAHADTRRANEVWAFCRNRWGFPVKGINPSKPRIALSYVFLLFIFLNKQNTTTTDQPIKFKSIDSVQVSGDRRPGGRQPERRLTMAFVGYLTRLNHFPSTVPLKEGVLLIG